MAFPQTAAPTETTFGANATAHLVTMPPTINAGDLLLVFFSNDGDATVATPSNWNLLASDPSGISARFSVYYKIAVGNEDGTTVDFVTSASEKAAAQVYRVTAWHGTTPPEISTAATDTTANPDPGSLSPSWGVADTLWFAAFGSDGTESVSVYPTNYLNGVVTTSGTANDSSTASARRELNASSDNPSAFTMSLSEQWIAYTVAVRPSAGGATQGLTGTLFTKAPTFSTGAVTSVRNLAGTLFTKAPTFSTGVVGRGAVNLAGALFTKSPTFSTGTIASVRNLAGTLFIKAPTFSQGTVVVGAANLGGVLFQRAPTFSQGAITTGAVNLSGDLFTKAPTFNTGTVIASQALAGTLFTKAPTFFTGTVVVGAANLSGVLFQKAPTFGTGAVTSTRIVAGVLFTKAPTFPQGAVTTGAVNLSGVLFENTPQFFEGAMGTGALDGVLFVSAPAFFVGVLTQGERVFPTWRTSEGEGWPVSTNPEWEVVS